MKGNRKMLLEIENIAQLLALQGNHIVCTQYLTQGAILCLNTHSDFTFKLGFISNLNFYVCYYFLLYLPYLKSTDRVVVLS